MLAQARAECREMIEEASPPFPGAGDACPSAARWLHAQIEQLPRRPGALGRDGKGPLRRTVDGIADELFQGRG